MQIVFIFFLSNVLYETSILGRNVFIDVFDVISHTLMSIRISRWEKEGSAFSYSNNDCTKRHAGKSDKLSYGLFHVITKSISNDDHKMVESILLNSTSLINPSFNFFFDLFQKGGEIGWSCKLSLLLGFCIGC